MGADENAAIVQSGYEAFNSADMETLTEIFDEGVVWHTPGRSSLAGDHQGHDATFACFGRLVGTQRNIAEREGKHLFWS